MQSLTLLTALFAAAASARVAQPCVAPESSCTTGNYTIGSDTYNVTCNAQLSYPLRQYKEHTHASCVSFDTCLNDCYENFKDDGPCCAVSYVIATGTCRFIASTNGLCGSRSEYQFEERKNAYKFNAAYLSLGEAQTLG